MVYPACLELRARASPTQCCTVRYREQPWDAQAARLQWRSGLQAMPEDGGEAGVLGGRFTVEMQGWPPAAYATTVRRAVTWPNGPWACPARAASVLASQRIGRFRSGRAGRIPGSRAPNRPVGMPRPLGRWNPRTTVGATAGGDLTA